MKILLSKMKLRTTRHYFHSVIMFPGLLSTNIGVKYLQYIMMLSRKSEQVWKTKSGPSSSPMIHLPFFPEVFGKFDEADEIKAAPDEETTFPNHLGGKNAMCSTIFGRDTINIFKNSSFLPSMAIGE